MSFDRPTLEELLQQALSDFDGRLPDSDARMAASNLNVLSFVLAAAAHGLHGHIAWTAIQLIWDHAQNEFLTDWAGMFDIRKKPAAVAIGTATFKGTDGAPVPAGLVLQRADGRQYETTAEGAIAAGTATVAIEALDPGLAGNAAAGVKLTLATSAPGLQPGATVAAGGLSAGADAEEDADLLARFLSRMRQPPHGGSASDYVAWALEVEGVTRAWVAPAAMGLGTVTVRFAMDGKLDTVIPTAGEVATVQAYMDTLRPVTAELFVVAPVPVALDLTIALDPNDAATQAAVSAEVTDFIRREAEPGGTIHLSRLSEAISAATGEVKHRIVSPVADVPHAATEMAVPGVLTWEAY